MELINGTWCRTVKEALEVMKDQGEAEAIGRLYRNELRNQKIQINMEWEESLTEEKFKYSMT